MDKAVAHGSADRFRRMMLKVLESNEVRCPGCGKLLLKGGFARGTWLDLRCPNGKCEYHRKRLVVLFQ